MTSKKAATMKEWMMHTNPITPSHTSISTNKSRRAKTDGRTKRKPQQKQQSPKRIPVFVEGEWQHTSLSYPHRVIDGQFLRSTAIAIVVHDASRSSKQRSRRRSRRWRTTTSGDRRNLQSFTVVSKEKGGDYYGYGSWSCVEDYLLGISTIEYEFSVFFIELYYQSYGTLFP